MRTLNLLSAVGVAIVATWLAVTNLAHASEFTCKVPWSGDTTCDLPKFNIPPEGVLTVEVYSIQEDGKDVDGPAVFTIQDVNKENATVKSFPVGPRTTVTWKYENKETPLTAQLRVNVAQTNTIIVRGRYTVSK